MRIALVLCVFPPEREPAGVMASQLARALSAEHEVRVICPQPNRPDGVLYPGFERRWHERSQDGPFQVDRVWSWFASTKGPLLGRALEAISFGLTAAWQVLAGPRADVVLLETWPMGGQIPVAAAARLRRIPVVNCVQDLYPEAAIAAGLIAPGSLAARVLRRVDAVVCASAACNVAVSPRMAAVLAARSPGRVRVAVVRHWIDTARVAPSRDGRGWRLTAGLADDDFVCMFAGTMGRASGVEVLADVADALRGERGIRIVCIGDGPAKAPLQRECERRGLENVRFFSFVPAEDVPRVQSAADVMLLTVAPGVTVSSVPSKAITYWAMGKPVLASMPADSDIAEIVAGEGLGEVVAPGDGAALAAAIRRMRAAGASERALIGARARAVAERDYSLARGVSDYAALFNSIGTNFNRCHPPRRVAAAEIRPDPTTRN